MRSIFNAEFRMQRNKIRRKYGISVEGAPLGEFCDGLLLDYCVVQFCPCLSLIQVYFRGLCEAYETEIHMRVFPVMGSVWG